jgi:hypothetical protein
MHLMTPESESWFVAHSICPSPSETGYQIFGVYTNKPTLWLRQERSKMHFGALFINTHGDNESSPTTLSGEYWTDRKTTGLMEFSDRKKQIFTRYKDAHSAFETTPNLD